MNLRRLLMLLFCVGIIGASLAGPNKVHAQTPSTTQTRDYHMGPFEGLAEFIAQKLGLDKNKVQAVVTQFEQQKKAQMQQQMQQRLGTKLEEQVKAGKITEAQKTLIINKLAELQKNRESNKSKNLTPEQRKQEQENAQNELKTWAQSQGIDPSVLMFGFGKRGMMRGKGLMRPTPTP
jgi:hypothetical protein